MFSARKKLVFQVECVILDLINIPYVSGFYFAKWRLRSSGAKGLTQRATVSDHVVTWNSSAVFEAGMYVGKDNVLQQCELQIVIKQEVNGGKSSEDVGSAVINLAECAGSRTTSRRLLLQDSRVNSVLRVTVNMKLLKGDPIYGVPIPNGNDLSIDGIRDIFSSDEHADRSRSLSKIVSEDSQARPGSVVMGEDEDVDLFFHQ